MRPIKQPQATCHPERKYFALGKCKECYYRDYNGAKNSTPEGKRYWHERRLKRQFDMTEEEYQEKHAEQKGVCAICGRPQKQIRLAVDHNHTTGQVRGLLCCACNRVVGYLENEEWMERAQSYLTKYKETHS